MAGVQITQLPEGEKLRQRLKSLVKQFQSETQNRKSEVRGAIIPIILGDEARALQAAAQLREQNIFVPAIRYPTVARGAARIRVTLTAAHSSDDISRLVTALKSLNIGL